MEKTRLNELYIYVDKHFYNEYFESYIRKTEKNAKIADFANFGPKYLGPQIVPRHANWGSKVDIVFQIYLGSGYLIIEPNMTRKFPKSYHLGTYG